MIPRRFYVIIWTAFLVLSAFVLSFFDHNGYRLVNSRRMVVIEEATGLSLIAVSAAVLIFGPSSMGHRLLLALPLPFIAALLMNWKLIPPTSPERSEIGFRTFCVASAWLIMLLQLWVAKRVLGITTALWVDGEEVAKTPRKRLGILQLCVVTAYSSALMFLARNASYLVPISELTLRYPQVCFAVSSSMLSVVFLLAPITAKISPLLAALGIAAVAMLTFFQGSVFYLAKDVSTYELNLSLMEANVLTAIWVLSVGAVARNGGFRLVLFDTSEDSKTGVTPSV